MCNYCNINNSFGFCSEYTCLILWLANVKTKPTNILLSFCSSHSSNVKLHHYKLQPPDLPPPRVKDDSQYETIEDAVISRNSVIQNAGALEEEFSFSSCGAYDTHKKATEALDYEVAISMKKDDMYEAMDGNGEGNGETAITAKRDNNAYESMDGTGQKTKIADKGQSYEAIRGQGASEITYEVVRGEGVRVRSVAQDEEIGGSNQDIHYVT